MSDQPFNLPQGQDADAGEVPVDPNVPPTALTLPPKRRTPWEWIVDYNPFYLLSAVSMLLGCLLLSNTTTWDPVPISRLLALLATLQVYELACLGIGLLLFRRIGPRRDAVQLLGLVLLFAVDVAFLMSEIATQRLWIGSLISLLLFGLALIKGALVIRVVGIRFDPVYLITGGAGLLALYVVPPMLTSLDDGRGNVEVLHFYGLWWLIGLSPLIFDAGRKWFTTEDRDTTKPRPSGWLMFIALLPWASLAVHTGVLHYVYDRPFMAPLAAPLLIGIALLLRRERDTFDLVVLRTFLVAVATLVSLPDPERLSMNLPVVGEIGAATIGGAAAWLAFAYCNAPALLPYFAGAGVGAMLLAWFGPTWEQISGVIQSLIAGGRRTLVSLVPRTRFAWGCVAVAMAFTFLALGALLSFGHRKQTERVATDEHR